MLRVVRARPSWHNPEVLAAALGSMLLALGPGEAEAGRLELVWDASAGCPGPAEVEAELGRFLSAPLVELEPTRVQGRVWARGPMFVLELDIRAAGLVEHHELTAATCAELGEAAGLLIAGVVEPLVFAAPAYFGVALAPMRPPAPIQRPSVTARLSTGASAEAAPTKVVAAPEPVDAPPRFELEGIPESESSDRPRRRTPLPWSALLHVTGGTLINLLPQAGGGARVGARAERGVLRVGGGFEGWFASGFRATDDAGVGGQLWAGSAMVVVCGVPTRHGVYFPLCAEAGGGFMHGRGVGIAQPQARVLPWAWLGVDAGIEWWFGGRAALTMGVAILGSLARPAFTLAGSDASWETPPVSARAELGVVVRLHPKRSSGGS